MKFLEDPMQTMGAGFALALVLIVVFLGMSGVGAGEADWVGMLFRWVHFLAGITWIGLLYFFNLINAAFLKSLDGPTKNVVIPKLMPAALNWFRHGATVTVLAGIAQADEVDALDDATGSHVEARNDAFCEHDSASDRRQDSRCPPGAAPGRIRRRAGLRAPAPP